MYLYPGLSGKKSRKNDFSNCLILNQFLRKAINDITSVRSTLSDCNGTRSHNHLVRKPALNQQLMYRWILFNVRL